MFVPARREEGRVVAVIDGPPDETVQWKYVEEVRPRRDREKARNALPRGAKIPALVDPAGWNGLLSHLPEQPVDLFLGERIHRRRRAALGGLFRCGGRSLRQRAQQRVQIVLRKYVSHSHLYTRQRTTGRAVVLHAIS